MFACVAGGDGRTGLAVLSGSSRVDRCSSQADRGSRGANRRSSDPPRPGRSNALARCRGPGRRPLPSRRSANGQPGRAARGARAAWLVVCRGWLAGCPSHRRPPVLGGARHRVWWGPARLPRALTGRRQYLRSRWRGHRVALRRTVFPPASMSPASRPSRRCGTPETTAATMRRCSRPTM